ncbi:hypothetical protein Bhyg_07655, partial [Pseudolycoriella hygida]
MKRKSGAQNRNSKSKKLRDESAALPGQLKISNIFSAKCEENANNDSIEKENRPRVEDKRSVVQETSISRIVFNPSTHVVLKENSSSEVLHGKIVSRDSVPILVDNGTNHAKEATFSEYNSDF